MKEVALLTSSGGEGLATMVDVLTGTQVAVLKHCSALPGSTALIAGDFVVSAQVSEGCLLKCARATMHPSWRRSPLL